MRTPATLLLTPSSEPAAGGVAHAGTKRSPSNLSALYPWKRKTKPNIYSYNYVNVRVFLPNSCEEQGCHTSSHSRWHIFASNASQYRSGLTSCYSASVSLTENSLLSCKAHTEKDWTAFLANWTLLSEICYTPSHVQINPNNNFLTL